MEPLFLLTGSNAENAAHFLTEARIKLTDALGEPFAASAIYGSEPWGKTDQAAFLNQALGFYSDRHPVAILSLVLSIETMMGRVRKEKWGPRTIDIDMLAYGRHVVQQADLIIPHPFLAERRFALLPLQEIAPSFQVPGKGPVSRLVTDCTDILKVWQVD